MLRGKKIRNASDTKDVELTDDFLTAHSQFTPSNALYFHQYKCPAAVELEKRIILPVTTNITAQEVQKISKENAIKLANSDVSEVMETHFKPISDFCFKYSDLGTQPINIPQAEIDTVSCALQDLVNLGTVVGQAMPTHRAGIGFGSRMAASITTIFSTPTAFQDAMKQPINSNSEIYCKLRDFTKYYNDELTIWKADLLRIKMNPSLIN